MSSLRGLLFSLCVVTFQLGCADDPFPNDSELSAIRLLPSVSSPPRSSTNDFADDPDAVVLGRALFADRAFSSCGTVACIDCHPPPTFAGNTAGAPGCGGVTPRNAPSVVNVGFSPWLTWDGQKDSIWAHAVLPLTNPIEMGATASSIRDRMEAAYAAPYSALFGGAPSAEPDVLRVVANFGKAVEAYVRTLNRLDAPFDDDIRRFVRAAEQGGPSGAERDPLFTALKVFVRTGECIACHRGPMLTDDRFHNVGLDERGLLDRGRAAAIPVLQADPFNSAGEYSDDPQRGQAKLGSLTNELLHQDEPGAGIEGAFRTPSLRNVADTAPYMHHGQVATLEEIVDFYARGGDPVGTFTGVRTNTIKRFEITPQERLALVELLRSLSGRGTVEP